ncbi:uncharacterized protein LOC131525620 [Onychostoma macrolepis]|uniref:uncharacterized protein LOC131525620 n=1 Tax=Onychostoma macrolepis TaxID=369639 RepID=UPI00272B2C5B|nr:uncharacterized protein LOC131525620 [Onychostoma macrolepis]XP_058609446.1 uncharacterized protein LOC131525620 [Onychostoma macrolepis]
MRSGFYSPYFIVPKKSSGLRPILDLRVLNQSLHKLPFKMLTQKRIFECIRPRDWFVAIDLKDAYFHVSILPRHRPFLCFAFEGRAYQYKVLALRAGPVSPRLHESRGRSPCSHEKTGCSHPQLSRRLAHSCSVSGAVVRTQGFGAWSPQPVGPSGQLGKEQTRPSAEDLFSRYGVGFGRTVSTPHRGTCSVGVELPEYIQRQDSRPTETFSEAPGAYGSRSGSNPAQFASYETASALASRPSPEMGVATRHVPSGNHSGMPPSLQPVVRPLVSSGRSAPRAGVPACRGLHGCLCHRLGCHVQWACSVRGVDGPPTALACQLPRVASSTPCPEPPEGAVTGQTCAGPDGQHCDRCVHQPSRGFALPSHVATRPPSPPLESEASEVASRHSCSGCALRNSSEEGSAFSETGHPLAPAYRPLETPCLVPGRDAEVLGDLPPEVLNTITSARAPSTRRAYALKWNLFAEWCASRRARTRRAFLLAAWVGA